MVFAPRAAERGEFASVLASPRASRCAPPTRRTQVGGCDLAPPGQPVLWAVCTAPVVDHLARAEARATSQEFLGTSRAWLLSVQATPNDTLPEQLFARSRAVPYGGAQTALVFA